MTPESPRELIGSSTVEYPQTEMGPSFEEMGKITRFEHLPIPDQNLIPFCTRALSRIAERIEAARRIVETENLPPEALADILLRFDREVFVVSGPPTAGKTLIKSLLEKWMQYIPGLTIGNVTWEKDGEEAARAHNKITTPRDQYFTTEERLWAGVYVGKNGAQKIKVNIATVVELPNTAVFLKRPLANEQIGEVLGEPRGLLPLNNLVNRQGEFANLDGCTVNLLGLVGGKYIRNGMVYFREDIKLADHKILGRRRALARAAEICLAYGKPPPTSLKELRQLQNDGAPPSVSHRIEEENNQTIVKLWHHPDFTLPEALKEIVGTESVLLQLLRHNQGIRDTAHASLLYFMFRSIGAVGRQDTFMFIGHNDPTPRDLGVDMVGLRVLERDKHFEPNQQELALGFWGPNRKRLRFWTKKTGPSPERNKHQ